ncbi:MAG: phage tail protein [Clostridia bacterium]|nr:phage tail protein [Clostridia bacterium]
MYQIKCDDYILFDLRDDEYIVNNPKLKLETNKVGELTFTIYDDHPHFDKIKKLKSIIRVYQFRDSVSVDGRLIFKGRVIEDTQDFDNAKVIECESKLAMLLDSQTPPFALENGVLTVGGQTVAGVNGSPQSLFKWVIEQHNAQVEEWQRFELDEATVTNTYKIDGEEFTKTVPKYCTVVDKNDNIVRSNTNYDSTFNTVQSKFIDLLGGYINVKYDVEKNGKLVDYIEYVHDFTDTATQQIEYGENLLDISQVVSGADIATVIIPLGKSEGASGAGETETEEETEGETASASDGTLTIAGIADGTYNDTGDLASGGDIVKSGDRIWSKQYIAEYGKIVKVVDFEDVTDAANLFKKAIAKLKNESVYLGATITLKAVDLALVDKDIESFYFQDKIRVFSRPHNIHAENNENAGATYLLAKIEMDLLEPQNTEIVLNKSWRTLTDVALGAGKTAQNTVNKIVADYATNERVTAVEKSVQEVEAGVEETARGVAEAVVNDAIGGEIDAVIESAIENTSIIAQTAEEIIFEVVQNYVEKTGYEERQEDISTTLQLLADEMVLKFNTAISEIENVDGAVQTQFQEISKYIRFVDGKIILGEVGNEITLEISNNRLSFLQNNLEVAYFSNNKLFVNHGEYLGDLKIGNFAFTPRSNGNMSLKLSTATTPDIEDEDDATQ